MICIHTNFKVDSNIRDRLPIGIPLCIPSQPKLSSCEPEEFNANDTPSRSLMMPPFAFPHTILSYRTPGDKTLSLHGGVLNGCVYDRISSVIKKALQCVRVSKRGRTTVVAVSTRSSTSTTSPGRDKTSAGGTTKFQGSTPVESNQAPRRWYILVVSIEVTESTTRGNSSYFALQIPRSLCYLSTQLLLLVPRDCRSTSSCERASSTNMSLSHVTYYGYRIIEKNGG